MLTGDAQESADAVAKETGIDEVHAKLLPQDKLSELKKIRESHGAVMFVGDGTVSYTHLYLCFPNNPTGTTITKAQLQDLSLIHI